MTSRLAAPARPTLTTTGRTSADIANAWIFFGIVVESREDAALLTFVDSNMKLAGTSVTARIDRAIDPPELQVEILGRPVSDEQEEEWRKQLAFTHPHIALSVFRTSIDEADIEDLQNQVQLMMSSYGDLSAKDKELARLRAELTLVEGEYRRLQETRLPESLGANSSLPNRLLRPFAGAASPSSSATPSERRPAPTASWSYGPIPCRPRQNRPSRPP